MNKEEKKIFNAVVRLLLNEHGYAIYEYSSFIYCDDEKLIKEYFDEMEEEKTNG